MSAPSDRDELLAGGDSGKGLATSAIRAKVGRGTIVALQLLTFVVLVTAWETGTRTLFLDPFFFSKPSDIGLKIVQWLTGTEIWEHLFTTLVEAMLAFIIGTAAGIVCGLAFARIELLAAV